MSDKKKQSVLIVESDDLILKSLSTRFKKQGMFVITAKDGFEGYNRACKESPDFIILEALLSSMSGFRISRLLKFDERYKDIKIIIITANDLESVDDMCKSSGADQILRKPFRFKELMEAITEKVVA